MYGSWYVRVQLVSSGSVLQTHHWNKTRARCLSLNESCKVGYDIFNQLGSYRNIIQFQIVLEEKANKEIPNN